MTAPPAGHPSPANTGMLLSPSYRDINSPFVLQAQAPGVCTAWGGGGGSGSIFHL